MKGSAWTNGQVTTSLPFSVNSKLIRAFIYEETGIGETDGSIVKRAPTVLPEDLTFVSQHPHGSQHPSSSSRGSSGTWYTGDASIHTGKTWAHIRFLKKKRYYFPVNTKESPLDPLYKIIKK